MLVSINQDNFGNLVVRPVSASKRQKYSDYLLGYGVTSDGSVYIQGDDVGWFTGEHLTLTQKRDVEHGWTICIRIDPWTYGHLLGWNAHTLEV